MVYREVMGLSISVVREAAGRESPGLYVVRIKGKKVAEYGLPLPSGRRKWIITWGPYEGLVAQTQYDLEHLLVMNVKSDIATQALHKAAEEARGDITQAMDKIKQGAF